MSPYRSIQNPPARYRYSTASHPLPTAAPKLRNPLKCSRTAHTPAQKLPQTPAFHKPPRSLPCAAPYPEHARAPPLQTSSHSTEKFRRSRQNFQPPETSPQSPDQASRETASPDAQ